MLFNSIKELLHPSDLDLSGSRGFHSTVTVLKPCAVCVLFLKQSVYIYFLTLLKSFVPLSLKFLQHQGFSVLCRYQAGQVEIKMYFFSTTSYPSNIDIKFIHHLFVRLWPESESMLIKSKSSSFCLHLTVHPALEWISPQLCV